MKKTLFILISIVTIMTTACRHKRTDEPIIDPTPTDTTEVPIPIDSKYRLLNKATGVTYIEQTNPFIEIKFVGPKDTIVVDFNVDADEDTIAVGEIPADKQRTFERGTFDPLYTIYKDNTMKYYDYLEDGIMHIARHATVYTISMELKSENGDSLYYYYQGVPVIEGGATASGPLDYSDCDTYAYELSDIEIADTIQLKLAQVAYYGAQYGRENSNYTLEFYNIEMYNGSPMYNLSISDLFSPTTTATDSLPVGTYEIAYTGNDFTLVPGYFDPATANDYELKYYNKDGSIGLGWMLGTLGTTLWINRPEGQGFLYFTSGTFKVECTESTYTITADLAANSGQNVVLHYVGPINISDGTKSEAPRRAPQQSRKRRR